MLNPIVAAHLRIIGFKLKPYNPLPGCLAVYVNSNMSVYFSEKRNKWDTVCNELYLLVDELNAMQERLSPP